MFGGGVRLRGKPKPASLGDKAGQWGEQAERGGRDHLSLSLERPGVERSPICGDPDAQSERSETEHRSWSKWARKRSGRVFRLRDKLESGAA